MTTGRQLSTVGEGHSPDSSKARNLSIVGIAEQFASVSGLRQEPPTRINLEANLVSDAHAFLNRTVDKAREYETLLLRHIEVLHLEIESSQALLNRVRNVLRGNP